MTSFDQAALDAVLRTDFRSFLHKCVLTLNPGRPFLPNWHIDAIAYQLGRVQRGEITRLIINLPPRNLKSILVSIAYPAFVLGHDPRQRIFGISYGAELAEKHARDFRSVVEFGLVSAGVPANANQAGRGRRRLHHHGRVPEGDLHGGGPHRV